MRTIIVLWILLGLIAVIVILLHFSLTAHISINNDKFDMCLRYMFFTLYPRPEKKVKKRKQKIIKKNIPESKNTQVDLKESFNDSLDNELEDINLADDVNENTGDKITDDITDNEFIKTENQAEIKPQKKIKATKKVKKAKTKTNKYEGIFARIKAMYNKYKPLIPMGWRYFKKLLKTIRFTNVDIHLTQGKADAYESAMAYGKLQAGVFNSISVLAGIFTVKIKKCDIDCVFNESCFLYDAELDVSVRPSTLIAISFCMLVNFLKFWISNKLKERRKANKRRKSMINKTEMEGTI